MRNLIAVAAISVLVASTATAKPALRDVQEIDNGLYVVGLAHEIRENCPTIDARMLRAISFLQDLKREARDLGYTDDEIRKHLKSKEEKKRLRDRAARYMESQGLDQDKEGYCALGKAEIEQNSEIGALLRASN